MVLLFVGLIVPTLAGAIESPLKQYDSKTNPHDIKCKPNLILIFKDRVWTPACVKISSIDHLIERGWAANHSPHHMDMIMPMEKEMNTDVSITSKSDTIGKLTTVSEASSFEECVAEGNHVMESYPRQCGTADGKHFVEVINGVQCQGNAYYISGGMVTRVIDGDTIIVNGQSIRFTLTSTPELSETGGIEAENLVTTL